MSNTAKLVVYVVLAGLGPALVALEHARPAWGWLASLASVISAIGAGIHVDPPGTSAKMARMVRALGKASCTGAVMLFAAVVSSGCSLFQGPRGAAVETAGIDLAVCVLNHVTEPVQQIVTDCGAATAQDVVRILDAHRAALAREGK